MKNFIYAFILSIIIHFLLFTSFEMPKPQIYDKPSRSKKISKHSNIKFVKLLSPKKPQVVQKNPKQKEIIKTKKKSIKKTVKPYKKVETKKIKKPIKRKIVKKEKTEIKKIPIKKQVVQPSYKSIPPKKPDIKHKQSLDAFLATPDKIEEIDNVTKSYLRLYGEEYYSYSLNQKKFLKNNLKNIGKITQKYLRYPSISIRTRQQGLNVVEFMLYPEGTISDLKLIGRSKYTALDKNTIRTIEIAYKDYPKPIEPTKIRIYVYYRLY